jgi:hypothetical protein
MGATNFHTITLAGGTMTIDAADQVMKVSVEANSGIVTVLGNVTFKGTPSNALTLTVGGGVTLLANSNNQPISGVTIDASGGSADVLLSLI